MEILIVLLIIGVMLFIFGVPLQTLLIGVAVLIVLLLVLMLLFFVSTALYLLFGFRRRRGRFLRFDANHRFEQAVYLVEDVEYTNIFPAESVLRQQIYSDRPRVVLISRSKRSRHAFDMHSVLILTLGLVGAAAALFLFVAVLRLFA